MHNKFILPFLMALAALLLCQCTNNDNEAGLQTPSFNPYVWSYTGGTISRKAEIQIRLTQEVRQGLMDSIQAAEIMKISPKVEGNYTFADQRTLVFTPTQEMKRNTRYNVSVKLSKLFDDAKQFEFSVQTMPLAIGGTLKTFDVTEDGQYELIYNLTSADSETPAIIEKHLRLSLDGEKIWAHAEDGLHHQLKVRLKPQSDCKMILSTTADKEMACEEKELSSVDLPSATKFAIVSQRCKPGETKCIEITFNKRLDSRQDIRGLVYMEDRSTQATMEGNKVYLYGNMRDNETVKVNIAPTLHSKDGINIGQEQHFYVTISSEKPAVEFVGDGTIIPQSDRILVPFRSIQMKGVRVLVYKIFNNNMGSIMQHGDIDTTDEFCYAARPIAATTFYVEDNSIDLSEWHTFAIDLTDQVRLEPGAMYRIELNLDARLSAWPNDTLPKATRQEMAEEDARILQETRDTFDSSYPYYYTGRSYSSYHWVEDYYKHHQDPSSICYYDNRTIGKNVLATNIGLSALKGTDHTLAVTAIHIPDAIPMGDVSIEAFNNQQQRIGTGMTSANGIATIHYDPQSGRPTYLIARHGNDVSYLKVSEDQSLSTSTFDVSGAVIERGLKGYIYGERGVWRPGDTLHIGFMLNDRARTLPDNHPVSLVLSNPLGQITHRETRTSGTMGIYSFHVPTPADAPTGLWNAEIKVGGVSFHKSLRIETIKPNRLKIDLTLPHGALMPGRNEAQLFTEWLNGSVANGLKYNIDATLIQGKTSWAGYKDYVFDDPTRTFETSEVQLAKGETGATGNANCLLNFTFATKAPGMLRANIVTHVYEPSGEFSVDVQQASVAPYFHFVGIKAPQQERNTHLDTGKNHSYHLVCVDKDGAPVPHVQLKLRLYKVDWYWWWSSSNEEMAGYTSSSYHTPVQNATVVTDQKGEALYDVKFKDDEWGTYLLVAEDVPSGHSAGVLSYYDWPWMQSRRSSNGGDNATTLAITTDKKEYAPGEKIRISIPSEEGSRAIVSINNGSHNLSLNTYLCQKEHTEIVIEATEEMTPNVYIGVSLIQPYSQTVNDMPIRMYGITPVTITSAQSHLHPVIGCTDEFLPEADAQVTVSEKQSREMGYTLAIVDEGLLDLTRFKTPDAWAQFNAREALGVRFWDLYRHVNGAYGGRIEQLFSIGGDDALNNGPKAFVNRFTPMVHFAGPFKLKKGEKRTHRVSVPNYNGRVRVMVVAGDGTAYGSTDKSVLVRRPLMMLGTMPRQIGRGDEMTVSATLFATQSLGDVKVTLSTSEQLQIVGNSTQTIALNEAGDRTIQFRIKATDHGGTGTVSLVATAKDCKADYTAQINIRTVAQDISQTISQRVEPGSTFDQMLTMPGIEGNKVLVDVSANKPLNIISRVDQLIAYPHGCVEQTTSKVFPQLYLSEYTDLLPAQQAQIEEHIKECISRLASFQTSGGGMSYWPNSPHCDPWASAYVLLFLHETSARGYYVPEAMLKGLKSYVSKSANAWSATKDESHAAAFQLYVLANMQAAEIGTMNRMKEHATSLSESSLCLLSAAYAMMGRADIGQNLLNTPSNGEGSDYWFSKEVARLLAYLHLGDTHAGETAEMIRQQLMSDQWLSTSQCAMSLIAMSRFYQQNGTSTGLKFRATLDKQELANIKSDRFQWSEERAISAPQTSLSVRNNGDAALYVTATAKGRAEQSKVMQSVNGLDVKLQYYTDNGQPLSPTTLAQSTTFRATLTIHNVSGNDVQRVAITHILPAGWEVLSTLPATNINYQDVRDDRVLSYIDLLHRGEAVSIQVNLSATYAGRYYLPSAHAEAMYDTTLSGCTESGECEVTR